MPNHNRNTVYLEGMTDVRESIYMSHWHKGELNSSAKVVILGATFHEISVRTHISIMEMAKPTYTEVVCPGKAQDAGRNAALTMAEKLYPDATHYLFLDYDEIFPRYMLEALLNDNKPIVSAWYFGSCPPWRPCLYIPQFREKQTPDSDLVIKNMAFVSGAQIYKRLKYYPLSYLQPGWFPGLGAVLIQKSAMEQIKSYWKEKNKRMSNQENWFVPFQQVFGNDGRLIVGEDHRFFTMCVEAGITPYTDLAVLCGHRVHATIPTHLAEWTDFEQNHQIFQTNVKYNLAEIKDQVKYNPELMIDLSPLDLEKEITYSDILKMCQQNLLQRKILRG